MRYLVLLLAGCSSVASAPEPCDHGNRRTYYAEMPFFASVYVCTKLNPVPNGYNPACAVWNDREAVIIKPIGETAWDAHESKHALCGQWHG